MIYVYDQVTLRIFPFQFVFQFHFLVLIVFLFLTSAACLSVYSSAWRFRIVCLCLINPQMDPTPTVPEVSLSNYSPPMDPVDVNQFQAIVVQQGEMLRAYQEPASR